jgi:glucokinase
MSTTEPYPAEIKYAIGIDRGGTNVRIGLVSSTGEILKLVKQQMPMRALEDMVSTGELLLPLITDFMKLPEAENKRVCGIGVSMAGVINQKGEVVDSCFPHVSESYPIPLQATLYKGMGRAYPVLVENDSKAATYGEYIFGAGVGTQNMVCFTIGTGVGGGLILNGKLFHGHSGYAGLLGFISVDLHGIRCPSGVIGCLDAYACGTVIRRDAQSALREGQSSILMDVCKGKIEDIGSEMVFEAARSGDKLSKRIIEDNAYALGIGIASILHIINPELVILGGGVVEQGEIYLDAVRSTVRRYALRCYANTPIKLAELGNLAGVVGAASLIMHSGTGLE